MMPSGKKFKNGYATVGGDGMKYREIAEIMTADGDKMNHSTARNNFLSAMKKLCEPVHREISKNSDIEPDDIYRNPDFQEGLTQIIADYYESGIDV